MKVGALEKILRKSKGGKLRGGEVEGGGREGGGEGWPCQLLQPAAQQQQTDRQTDIYYQQPVLKIFRTENW
jgi:hypothetical protein